MSSYPDAELVIVFSARIKKLRESLDGRECKIRDPTYGIKVDVKKVLVGT
jgi:hypothetical protein